MVYLPTNAKRVATIPDKRCTSCMSLLLELEFRRDATDGTTPPSVVGCVVCDEALHSLIEMKHGKSAVGRRRGGGGGGGRKVEDPRMSFKDF
jgi:DNA topoisomerase-3